MNDVTGDDVMLHKHPRGFYCFTIKETPQFSISLFTIPKGRQLPLHDHPQMTVVGKVITGSLVLRAFDWENPDCEKTKRGRTLVFLLSDEVGAKLVFDKVVSCNSPPMFLLPRERNVHELTALEDSALFDILAPPYDDYVRPCTFYSAKRSASPNEFELSPRIPYEYNCEPREYVGPQI